MVKEEPGNNDREAVLKGNAINQRHEKGPVLVEKELAALGEDKSGEGRGRTDDGARGRGDECVKIRALEHCDLMPVSQEVGTRGGKGP